MHNSTVSRSPHMPTATATLRLSGILQQRVYSGCSSMEVARRMQRISPPMLEGPFYTPEPSMY